MLSNDGANSALTDYSLNCFPFGTGLGASSWKKQLLTVTQVAAADGTSNTIAVGEKSLRWDRYASGTGTSWDDAAFRSWGGSTEAGPPSRWTRTASRPTTCGAHPSPAASPS